MDLKSEPVFWPQIYPHPEPRFPKLDRDLQCDVAIIGGGISGALAAYHLVKQGIQTVVIDRRRPAHGSTAASTGLLLYEIDTPLMDLTEKIGANRAIAAYQASVDALLAFEPLVAELGDPCGLVARPSLYLASEENDVETLRDECEARRAMGIEVMFLDPDALHHNFGIARPAALWSKRAFEVDPFRLTLQLIRKSVDKGLEVFAETEIVRHAADQNGVTLHASNGARVSAKKVIFATGYETYLELPPNLCRLSSTYAMVTEPVSGFDNWPQRCLIWETARPYLYLRTTQDGRVIVGGEDVNIVEPRARDQLLEPKATALSDRFTKLFPSIKIECATVWAGTFAQTSDGLPYIGTLPQFPHSYFALGYGGNGITFSLLAARIIRDSYLGKQSQDARLFGFDR